MSGKTINCIKLYISSIKLVQINLFATRILQFKWGIEWLSVRQTGEPFHLWTACNFAHHKEVNNDYRLVEWNLTPHIQAHLFDLGSWYLNDTFLKTYSNQYKALAGLMIKWFRVDNYFSRLVSFSISRYKKVLHIGKL